MNMIRLTSGFSFAVEWATMIIGAWAGLATCAYAMVPDVIQRPSLISTHAASRTMLAITRAEKRLVAVGERGIVLLSDDNGNSWRQGKVPVSVTLTAVHFPTATKGWAVGHSGVVLHSANGGESWSKQLDGISAANLVLASARRNAESSGSSSEVAEAEQLVADGADKPFLDVRFIDEMRGLVVGAFGLAFFTEDSGKHWQVWSKHIPNPTGKHLYRIYQRATELWIAGEQGALFRSNDYGMSFSKIWTPYAGSYFGVIAGTDGELVVFGLRGNAYYSGDGGLGWHKISNSVEAALTGGMQLADGSLILVDQTGRVLRSSDQGHSFVKLTDRQSLPVTGVNQAADGGLVLASFRWVIRIPPAKLAGTR